MRLTEEEYAKTIGILAKSVIEPLEKQVKKLLPKNHLEDLLEEESSEVSIKFTLKFTISDIIQILDAIREGGEYALPDLWRRNRYVLL